MARLIDTITPDQIDRMSILLKATRNILNKCNDSGYVMDVMHATDVWDGTVCDGYCLLEEISELIEEIERNS